MYRDLFAVHGHTSVCFVGTAKAVPYFFMFVRELYELGFYVFL